MGKCTSCTSEITANYSVPIANQPVNSQDFVTPSDTQSTQETSESEPLVEQHELNVTLQMNDIDVNINYERAKAVDIAKAANDFLVAKHFLESRCSCVLEYLNATFELPLDQVFTRTQPIRSNLIEIHAFGSIPGVRIEQKPLKLLELLGEFEDACIHEDVADARFYREAIHVRVSNIRDLLEKAHFKVPKKVQKKKTETPDDESVPVIIIEDNTDDTANVYENVGDLTGESSPPQTEHMGQQDEDDHLLLEFIASQQTDQEPETKQPAPHNDMQAGQLYNQPADGTCALPQMAAGQFYNQPADGTYALPQMAAGQLYNQPADGTYALQAMGDHQTMCTCDSCDSFTMLDCTSEEVESIQIIEVESIIEEENANLAEGLELMRRNMLNDFDQ